MKGHQLRVATFNVGGGRRPDLNALHQLLVTQAIDVIGLQEVDRNTPRNPHDMVTAIAGDDFHTSFAQTLTLGTGAYGIALLSKWPLIGAESALYHASIGEARTYQCAEVHVLGTTIALYNTHLAFESRQIRAQQVAELKQVLASDAARETIVFGDFNMDQSHDEWQLFSPQLQGVNGAHGQWLDTFLEADPNMRTNAIDNILVSAGLQASRVQLLDTGLSDHGLLLAELQVK